MLAITGQGRRSVRGLGAIGAVVVALVGGQILVAGEWGWYAAFPQDEDLASVWGSGPNDVFAVGANGCLLHCDGTGWAAMPHPASSSLTRVWGLGPNDVYAVGRSGTVLHYDGVEWSRMEGAPAWHFSSVWGSAVNDIYVGSLHGGLVHYDGTGWATVWEQDDIVSRVAALWGNSAEDVYALGQWEWVWCDHICYALSDNKVLHYNGTGWSTVVNDYGSLDPNRFRNVWSSGPDDVFVACSEGAVLHYDGSTWTTMSTGTSTELDGLWGTGPNDVYVCGKYGSLLHYDGSSWSSVDCGSSALLTGVWASGSTDIHVVGVGGVLRHWDGTAWSDTSVEPMDGLRKAWGTAQDKVWVVGEGGLIVHFDGLDWALTDSGTTEDLYDVWGLDANNVFAVGAGGTIVKYDGSAWASVTSGTTQTLWGVCGTGPNEIYAVGANGTVVRYDGASWSPIDIGFSDHIYCIWCSPSGFTFAGAANSRWLRKNPGSSVWGQKYVAGGGEFRAIWGMDYQNVYLLGAVCVHWDGWVSNVLELPTDRLHALWGSDGNDIHAVGQFGRAAHYDGTTWSLINAPTAKDLWGVWGTSSTEVLAVGSGGVVLRYPRRCQLSLGVVNDVWGDVTIDPNQAEYLPDDAVTLTAVPEPGRSFGGWSGSVPAGHEMDNPLIITMDSDKRITATFKCGSGLGTALPLLAVGLCGLALLRRRR
ncbi:MAG: hypothetical protein JXQ73_10115 [Phycisphaerae bacterium]|nr:hypothetical protein [Phycisphaerae bacterium]